MTPAFTPWFTIDRDGQPTRTGYYDVLYSWEPDDLAEEKISIEYWNGKEWLDRKGGDRLAFGNWSTNGERWRGLAAKARTVTPAALPAQGHDKGGVA